VSGSMSRVLCCDVAVGRGSGVRGATILLGRRPAPEYRPCVPPLGLLLGWDPAAPKPLPRRAA
jgi:hypothetical protein